MRTSGPLAAATLAVVLTSACGDSVDRLVGTIDVSVDIRRQTVPGAFPVSSCTAPVDSLLGPGTLVPISVGLRGEEELRGNELVDFDDVVLEDVTLNIIDVPAGDTDTFDFLDSVRIFADNPADPDPPRLVAVLDPVPRGQTRIVIPGTGVDVADLARADNFTVSGTVAGRLPCDEVNLDGEIHFDVDLL